MSIFGDSTPDFSAPEQDTVEETAEIQEEISETNEEIEQETTETNEETDSHEEHSEELLAGKYKTTADLVKGYKHLEQQFHQSRQQPTQQQPQVEQQQQVDYNEIFYERFNQDPLGTLEFLVNNVVNQKTAPIYEERQQETLIKNVDLVAKEYKQINTDEGYKSIMQKVDDLAQELGNPKLAQNPSPRVLKMAAQELWGDSKAQMFSKAKEQGRQEAEEARRAKQGVSSIGVTKKPNEAPRTEADTIVDNIMAASKRTTIFG